MNQIYLIVCRYDMYKLTYLLDLKICINVFRRFYCIFITNKLGDEEQ